MATMTATQIADELDISHSYLYYLKNNGAFDLNYNDGKPIWSAEVVDEIKEYMSSKKTTDDKEVAPPYRTTKINNRRYLGNKYKLLDFISEVVDLRCKDINTVADIFAGTGAVASAFIDKKIITNDLMYSNYICHVAWFGNGEFSEGKIAN